MPVTGVKGCGQSALGTDEIDVPANPLPQGAKGRELDANCGRRLRACVDLAVQDGHDEVGAAREVAVERPHASRLWPLPDGDHH
ncbi:MAG: hypothetical protein ACREQM_20790 [Candidatus Dormibacteraceae bacterium]